MTSRAQSAAWQVPLFAINPLVAYGFFFKFSLKFAAEQPIDHSACGGSFIEQPIDGGDDRHLDSELLSELVDGGRVRHPFGDRTPVPGLRWLFTLGEGEAEFPITRQGAGAGENQVAHPGETRHGFAITSRR